MINRRVTNVPLLVWLAAIAMAIIAIASFPHKEKLTQTNQRIASTTTKIKKTTGHTASSATSPDNYSEEQSVAQSMHDNVALAYGGIHSDSDLKSHQKQLHQVLGKRLTDQLIKYGRDVNSHEYTFTKNKDVVVSFGKATNSGQMVPVTILATAVDKDNNDVNCLVTMKYDMEGHRIVNYQFAPLSTDPEAVQRRVQ